MTDDKDRDIDKSTVSDKSMSTSRMHTLFRIDEFLTQRGRDENPATVNEICAAIGFNNDQVRGVRKNLDFLCRLSDDYPKASFRITKIKGKSVKYMIEPGHSLFRRDLNSYEKKLIGDLFHIMGSFNLPSFSQIEDLRKEAFGSESEIVARRCVDFGIQPPADKKLFSVLFDAISDRRVVKLSYRPTKKLSDPTAPTSDIYFCPWQLKLFGDRWGVIGMDANDSYILKFYLDQIQSIMVLSEKYDENEMKRMDHLFENVVGMSTPRHLCEKNPDPKIFVKPQFVYIWVDSEREQYLRTFPLHDNMDEIDAESEEAKRLRAKFPKLPKDGAIFWIYVYVDHPLKQALVSYLDKMIVLEPDELRLDLEDRVKKMSKLYSDLSSDNEQ